MIFLSVELAGYNRIKLSGTSYIKISPTEIIQLILGTNGSGKSSILDEITPLPSIAANYEKEGFSVKRISHLGHMYVLKSSFNPTQKHSLIKDGVEMNQGGTISVQKELVRQEFGITNEIHELLIGREKFTEMSPSQRRYWFTQLSPVNYDYSIGVFNKLKERLRDTSGAIKLNKNRLVVEMSKTMSEGEEMELRSEVESIHSFLNHILEYRKPLDHNLQQLDIVRVRIEETIVSQTKLLWKKINRARSEFSFGGAEHINELLVYKQSKEQVLTIQLDDMHTELSKLMESVSILEQTGTQGVSELNEKIKKLLIEQRGVWSSKELFKDIHKGPVEALKAIETITDTLVSICMEMPSNSDKRYSRDSKETVVNSLFEKRNTLGKIDVEIGRLQQTKKHFDDHKRTPDLECPKCSHKWKSGYSEEQHNKTIEDIESFLILKSNTEKEINVLVENNKAIDDYFSQYRGYQSLVSTWGVLKPLWDYIEDNNLLLLSPSTIPSVLNTFISDVQLDNRYVKYDEEINHIKELIEAKKELDDVDLGKIKLMVDKLENSIYERNKELAEVKSFIFNITSYKRNLEDISSMEIKLSELENELLDNKDQTIESSRRQYLIEAIRKVQSILSRKEEILSDVINKKSIIESISSNIQKLEHDEKCLKVIVSELSPTDGLIAEGLFGFIKVFTAGMNTFIKKVWSYPLLIQSCKLSEDSKLELDYKFPLKVGEEELPVPDVSKGSTGMREIINLAFKVLAIKHLLLTEMPLFLDEFGSAMDHTHRTTAYGIFDYLINEINFSQVFMVNHYSDLYGSLKNAEICVLHDSNIVLPKDSVYNKHVIMA